ncbi:hypothetical protein [Prevotella sp. MA2016]|uniref:hypothetical protein n=1 Tax=Prevotella sp. MA2016 TaxID=1408310 RepID=UPI0012DEC849|nr:hypothetical protein [Prevotella sp. MA2016]
MQTRKSNILGKQVMVEGLMTFGKLETGERTLDFECCEEVVAEPFRGNFYVQGMRDGNVYLTENLKRKRNKPLYRDDNCSLSHGNNGKYYFVFTMDDNEIDRLPQQLVQQAGNIARKVLKEIIFKEEVMG